MGCGRSGDMVAWWGQGAGDGDGTGGDTVEGMSCELVGL